MTNKTSKHAAGATARSSVEASDPTRRRARAGLLASTALVTASLAASGAFAQTTVVPSPGDPAPGQTAIAGGTTLQLNNTSGSVNWLDGYVFTGSGTLETNTTGASSFALRSEMRMSAGGVLNVNSGTFAGSSDGQGNWTNNLGSLNINAGATFDGVEGAIFIDALTGSGRLAGGFAGSRTTTIGVANGSGTFDGVITDSVVAGTQPTWILALTHVGTGTQTLTGVNTYTGATTITGGTIALSGSGSIAQSGSLTIGSAGTFDISGLAGGTTVNALQGAGSVILGANTLTATGASSTFFGSITGSGGFTHTGANTLTLTGINNWTGVTTVNGGFLRGTVNSISGSSVVILGGAFLEIDQATPGTFTQDISGAGTVRILGSGVQTTLSGNITTTGGLVHQSGNANLVLSGTRSNSNVDGVQVNGTLSITDTGQVLGGGRVGVYIQNPSTLNNRGTITNTGQLAGGFGIAGSAVSARSGTVVNNGAADDAAAVIAGSLYGIHHRDIGTLTLTNFGTVAGGSNAVFAVGAITITNNATGVIGVGSVDGAGVYAFGGTGYAINLANGGTITNSGTIRGGGAAIFSNAGTLTLTNTGAIRGGQGFAANTQDAIWALGGTILNSGTITVTDRVGTAGEPTYSAINLSTGGGTITNAAGGILTGGTDTVFGMAVQTRGVTTFNNYGSATGDATAGAGFAQFNNQTSTINLHAGSLTGSILTGSANDTLSIYSGRGTAGLATTDGASGITLQNAGTLGAAVFGTADLGGGTNTLRLRGTGDGTAANGASGTYNLSGGSVIGASILSKLDLGTWTLTGNGAGITTINAGDGGNNDGLLIFNGTGLTADINVNGATVRAATTTAFGTGTLHMIDPTAEFAAIGTYANNISLEVVNGQQAIDPTILRNTSGGTITLSGRIYETAGVGGANQYVTFDGSGTTILTNTGNIWGGVTAINAGTTLQGATNTISGGSVANAGALVFSQGVTGTYAGNISGAGTLQINAPSQAVTLSGVNTGTGATTITAGTLIASGGSAIGNLSAVNIAAGATLQLSSSETIGSLAGAGSVALAANTLTAGGDNTSTTFSGGISDLSAIAFLGSWRVDSGAPFGTRPPVYTAQQAAALLFGGVAADYRISTVSDQVAAINDAAWYAIYNLGWQSHASNYSVDNGLAGYSQFGDASAYVRDFTDPTRVNYAFGAGATLGGGFTKTGTGTLILTGTNTYTGLTTIAGGVLDVRNGAAISNLSVVNVLSPGAFTVTNSETIASLIGTGATTIAAGQTLTLATGSGTYTGAITGGQLTLASGSWTFGGTRSGGSASGVYVNGANTTLTVANGGQVLGGEYNGVRVAGVGDTVTNLGLIQNSGTGADGTVGAGIYVINAGQGGTTTVNNGSLTDTGAGSTIQGRNAGVRHESGSTDLLVVNNYGLIVGDLYNGVENTGGSLTVNNFSGGYITTLLGNGVSSASAGAVSVTNAGVIGRNIAGNVTVNGYGVTTNGALTLNNQSGGQIFGTLGGVQTSGALSGSNAGTITGVNGSGLIVAGGSFTNALGGTISGLGANSWGIRNTGSALTLGNAGTISGLGDGISSTAGLILTNSGTISGTNYAGVAIRGGGSVTNSGTITGNGFYGIQNATNTGTVTITNQSGGVIGGAGSILIDGSSATIINLQAGSTTNGQIVVGGAGGVTATIAGTLNGAYNAGSTSGIDILTLASTGSMTSANLGGGADMFTYQGGSVSGVLDGGTGTDSFASTLGGAGVATLSLTAITGFETFAHNSGQLTLTGAGGFTNGATVNGGTLLVNGTLSADTLVNSGATLGGTGTINGALTIANGGVLTGTQGGDLAIGSLNLSSGSIVNATFSGAGGPALFAINNNLTLDGTLNVASSGAYGFGVYGLMTYGGVLTDNGLTLGTTPGGAQRMSVQTSVAGQINVVHAPTTLLFWDGGNGGQHDNGAVNGGAGVWTAAGSEWTDANGLFNGAMEPQPGFAIFQGTGGLITVDDVAGDVGVTGMQFAADGYSIQGDSITLAAATTTIRVGNGTLAGGAFTTVIGSELTGAGQLAQTDLGTLILTGDNTYTGGTSIDTGRLQIGAGGTTGSILGAVTLANGGTLTFARSDNHVFNNAVSGTGSVVINGVVTLTGPITSSFGVNVGAGSIATLSNVSLTSGNAVIMSGSNATVNLANGGVVQSLNGTGIFVFAANGFIDNLGTISGSNTAVYANADLTLTNGASGSITGLFAVSALQNLNLTNNGSINATVTNFNSSGIYAGGTGTILNTGSITSGTNAIYTQGTGSVTNSGLIRGGGAASTIRLFGANSIVTNQAGGEINTSGTGTGVYLDGTGSTVINAGTIRGASAVSFIGSGGTLTNTGDLIGLSGSGIGGNGGSVTNLAGGSITGQLSGVTFVTAAGSVTNAGTIAGTTAHGVNLNAGGVVDNSGTISGALVGVRSLAGLNLTSSGSISGGGNAVESVGAFNDTLTFVTGSTTTGSVLTDAGDDLISLAGLLTGSVGAGAGADTVTLFDTGSFSGLLDGGDGVDAFVLDGSGTGTVDIGTVVNFESRTMQGAGVFTLTGADTSSAGWAINAGVLAASGGLAIGDDVTVTIGTDGTLALLSDEAIGSLVGSGQVELGANTLGVVNGGTWDGVIGGAGGLTLIGGTLTLSGANTYTGLTNVLGGTLAFGASDVLSDLTWVNVATGATLDVGTFSDTVGLLGLSGTLDGTGTLTAGEYQLNAATVNANLGAGNLFQVSGVSTLNGTSASEAVTIAGGTLTLGASDRLSDTATLLIGASGTLDLGVFDDTVGMTGLSGTLDGTGTLTASQYELDGATVNANLGTGNLYQLSGVSTLNGTSASDAVTVVGGTLTLGAADRLSDTATLMVGTAGTLDIGAFDETVGISELSGTLNGTGTLTAGEYQLNGATVNANLGTGNLFQVSGVSTLNGTSASEAVNVAGGTLALGAADRLSDTATLMVGANGTLDLGAFDETVGIAGLSGILDGTGTLTAGEYQLNGATLNANLGAGNLFQVSGVSTLNGTSASEAVTIAGGTLTLGAPDRLSDTATLLIGTGGTLDLGAFDETVGVAGLNGTLDGTGTLTAGEYQLNGATVNANLGAGNLFQVSGVSTMNGTSGSQVVSIAGGTLALGASNRLSDTATVVVGNSAVLNLNAFNDTVGLFGLSGTLNGTGTLTAGETQLSGATVNASLAGARLFNLVGESILNGTAAQNLVSVQGGTLRLGASERLSDTATVSVSSGATLAVGAWQERIGSLYGMGDVTVGSTGRLTLGGAESGFGGRLSGAGTLAHAGGLFTLLGDHTIANITNQSGELRFLGSTTGAVSVTGETLTGAGTIGGALRVSNGAVLSPGLADQLSGIGGFTVGGLNLTGGRLNIDVTGRAAGSMIDQIRVLGTATLTGGTVAPLFQGPASGFDFSTRYLFLQANQLVGTFSNGSAFTAAAQDGLFWRVRYDLAPNSAVLELRQLTDFDPGQSGTENQGAVGSAFSVGQLEASDDYAAVLSILAGLSVAERNAAFDSVSGEALADMTTSLFSANEHFMQTVQSSGGRGDSNSGSLSFASQLSLTADRASPASQLAGVLNAYDPGASMNGASGGWVSVFTGDQELEGKRAGQATVDSRHSGFAGGYGVSNGPWSFGGAAGVSRMEGDVVDRASHYETDLSHAAGYFGYDDGQWAADVTASVFGGEADTRRTVTVGAFSGTAIGDTHAEGQAIAASVARRFRFEGDATIALGVIGTLSNASVDGFTETGAGALSLTVAGLERDWQTLNISARASQPYRVNGRTMKVYGGMGVLLTTGDREATGDMRFSGAPTGFGTFSIEGAETPPLAGVTEFGLEVEAADGVSISAGYRGLFSERLTDNQVGMKLNVRW